MSYIETWKNIFPITKKIPLNNVTSWLLSAFQPPLLPVNTHPEKNAKHPIPNKWTSKVVDAVSLHAGYITIL